MVFARILFCSLLAIVVADNQKATFGGSKTCSHTGFYTKKVVPLCERHFPDDASKNVWVVQFYHPYVQKVHETQETYEFLAHAPEKLDGAKVGAVDCAQNQEFCAKQGVREVPTTRVILKGRSRDYEGKFELEALRRFVLNSVKRFNDMEEALKCNFKGLFTDPMKDAALPLCTSHFSPSVEELPWLISFYETGDINKDKTMRKSMNKLAEKYGNVPPKKVDGKKKTTKIRVGGVDCSVQAADCEKLGITTYPTVRFYREGADPAVFDSFFDSDEVKEFADAQLKAMPKKELAKVDSIKADMPETETKKQEL